ncbi:MAG: pilus assembly protein TadG-related protein [Alphaproteobacteria bacterium]
MTRPPSILRRFGGDAGGNVFAIVALGILGLTAAVGSAVDAGRGEMVRTKLQNSLDAAGLAAGASLDTQDLNSVVSKYMNVNFTGTGTLGATITSTTASLSTDQTTLTVTAVASLPTTFMKIFAHPTITLNASTQVTRAAKGMELVLVMDNTGSMTDPAGGGVSKIAASISAANSLLNILYGSNDTQNNLWVGLVPFSQAVNIGTGYPGWVSMSSTDYGPVVTTTGSTHCPAASGFTATYTSSLPGCSYKSTGSSAPSFGSADWRGCVLSRPTAYDTSDDPPSVKIFQPYVYPTTATGTSGTAGCTGGFNGWSCSKTSSGKKTTYYDYSYYSSILDNKGPNALCPQQAVQPMVAEKSIVSAAINNMKAAGDTDIDIGLVWGWRMLSPRWRTLWGGEMNTNNLPLDYNAPLMNKVVVLMTDGDNHYSPGNYSAYGFLSDGNLGTTSETTAEGQLNTRTAAVCTAMKAQGILIYTIALGTDISATGQTLLRNCATSPDYYFASPTTADLQTDFQMIGDSLANLRISR